MTTFTPTGIAAWDTVLVVAFWALAVLVLVGARYAFRLGVLLLTVVLAGSMTAALLGLAGLSWVVVSELRTETRARSLWVNVPSAVLGAAGMLSLRSPLGFGSASIIAGLAFVAAAHSALDQHRVAIRVFFGHGLSRRLLQGAFITLGLVVLGGAAGGLWARAAMNDGVSEVRRGVGMARHGEADDAAAAMVEARRSFDRADDRLGSWWVQPGRLVPVLGQHLALGSTLAEQGSRLSLSAQDALVLADLDSLRSDRGGLDLERVRGLVSPLERTEAALRAAVDELERSDSPWLVAPVDRQLDETVQEIDRALPGLHGASTAARLVPVLLGSERPRRYAVIFGTPAEARELGGIIGNVIEISAEDGQIAIASHLNDAELNAAGPGTLSDRSSYPARFLINRPETFTQNWSGMADFPSVARAVGDLYATMGGGPVDGVIYVDPFGLAAIMAMTGPVDLPELGRSLDADTIVSFLLYDQYALFDEKSERVDFLDRIAVETFNRLLTADLADPGALLGPLKEAVAQDRIRMATVDQQENLTLDQLGLLDPVPPPDGTDRLAVMHTNAGSDKLDAYLRRSVQYIVDLDPDTGSLAASVAVTLTNTVEPEGLPSYVTGLPSRAARAWLEQDAALRDDAASAAGYHRRWGTGAGRAATGIRLRALPHRGGRPAGRRSDRGVRPGRPGYARRRPLPVVDPHASTGPSRRCAHPGEPADGQCHR